MRQSLLANRNRSSHDRVSLPVPRAVTRNCSPAVLGSVYVPTGNAATVVVVNLAPARDLAETLFLEFVSTSCPIYQKCRAMV